MDDRLLPCPFCGSTDVAHGLFSDNEMFVRCLKCDTCGPFVSVPEHTMEMPKYIQSAQNAWNTRALRQDSSGGVGLVAGSKDVYGPNYTGAAPAPDLSGCSQLRFIATPEPSVDYATASAAPVQQSWEGYLHGEPEMNEKLASELREILGTYNDDDKPIVELVKVLVSRADDKLAAEVLQTHPSADWQRGMEDAARICKAMIPEDAGSQLGPMWHTEYDAYERCAAAIRAKIKGDDHG